ncbi:hypothetical protein M3J09_006956 [Ascochyta lentis]
MLLLTVPRLDTSSSEGVFGFTAPTEILQLAPKAESISSVNSTRCTVSQRSRRSRRKALRKRFNTFISYFACTSRQSVREVEEQETTSMDPTLASQGIEYKRVSEMAGSESEIHHADGNEWWENQFRHLLELDSYFLWNTPELSAPQAPFQHVSVEDCEQALPDLSPPTTSQDSSPISPNTPTTAGGDPSLCQQNGGSDVGALWPQDIAVPSHHQHESYEPIAHEMPAGPVSSDFVYLSSIQGIHQGLLNQDTELSENRNPQFDGSNKTSWSQMGPTILHSDLQQAISLPTSTPTPEDKFARRVKALVGTWESVDDSTWARLDEDGSIPDADVKVASTSNLNHTGSSPDDELAYAARNDHANDKAIVSPLEASSAMKKEKKKWLPVKCKYCNLEFTGEYGAGNMTRHVNNTCKKAPNLQKTHDCRICKKSYNRSDALRNHNLQEHKNSITTQPRKKSARMLGLVEMQQAS